MLESKIRCAEMGRRWVAEFTRTHARFGESAVNPQYAYDSNHETCLCYFHLMHYAISDADVVTDVLADKDILIWKSNLRGVDVRATPPKKIETREEFDNHLFSLGFQP